MAFSKIRIRGDVKANWENANPILAEREWGVEWETTIGVGEVNVKIGTGTTAWNDLDYAQVKNITKKIVSSIAAVSAEYPSLDDGDSLDTLFGKIKKYIQDLKDKKLDKSAKYDGVDSTSTDLYATANAVRQVNVKADKNATDITTLNNNLSKKFTIKSIRNQSLDIITETGWYSGDNIKELASYKLSWCMIHAMVQSDNAATIYVSGNDGKQLIVVKRNSDGIYLFTPCATKSDLSNFIIEKGFQKSVDVPAGNAYSTTECDIEYTVPSGYKTLAVYKGLVTNGTCCVYNSYFKDGKARLVISNLNGSQKTVTAYAFILFIKS